MHFGAGQLRIELRVLLLKQKVIDNKMSSLNLS